MNQLVLAKSIEVDLKLVFSLSFILMTVFGVFSQGNSSCLDDLQASDSQQVLYSAEDSHSHQGSSSSQPVSHQSDCSHHSSAGHNCHLGHCAFTLGSNLVLASLSLGAILDFNEVSFIIFDFQSGPFRPPIA